MNTIPPKWPTFPDGRRKTLGQMTKEEQRQILRHSLSHLKKEFESPEIRAVIENE